MASAEISNDYDVAVSWYYDISWWFFDYCVFVLNAPFSISNFKLSSFKLFQNYELNDSNSK